MDKNYALEELPYIAKEILNNVTSKVLLFYGEMGVGKTTLIKQLCKELTVVDTVSSPTFSLVNEYRTEKDTMSIYHFDFYRIKHENEAYDIGFEDYLYNNQWCFIEWPENVKNLLPLDAVAITISLTEDGKRNIQLKTN